MKVFLYIRVACADQLAAADQREELERYAKDKGYEVAAAVAADGISGVHTEGIMNFLLNEAKRQDIGTILTRDTSRISRDTSSFMRFERKFRENGIRFEYLSKPDNELPVTPMLEAFAAAYKKRRTKNGTSVFVKEKVKQKGTKKLSGRSTCSLELWAWHMSLFNAPARNFPCSF